MKNKTLPIGRVLVYQMVDGANRKIREMKSGWSIGYIAHS